MKRLHMSNKRLFGLIIAGIAGVLAGVTIWRFSIVTHTSIGTAERTFVLNCQFAKFRQIMIRKNATAAIVSAGGMRLIDEQVEGISLDTSKDDHPILSAIIGKSKAEVAADKTLTVELNDPNIDASELRLKQQAVIDESSMSVETSSIAPAGQLRNYKTTLEARETDRQTTVTIRIEMQIDVQLPIFFTRKADERVTESAERALAEQETSIEAFVDRFANSKVIIPDFPGKND